MKVVLLKYYAHFGHRDFVLEALVESGGSVWHVWQPGSTVASGWTC